MLFAELHSFLFSANHSFATGSSAVEPLNNLHLPVPKTLMPLSLSIAACREM
jgi:hypothetical protein